MLRTMLQIIELGGVPTLIFFAWHSWLSGGRAALPAWRNGLGLAALILVSLGWILAALSLVSDLARLWIIDSMWSFDLTPALGMIAAILAIALRGRSRLLTALAGLLTLTFWAPFVYV